MNPVPLEKIVLIRTSVIKIHIFWQLRLQKFPKKLEIEDTEIETFYAKEQMAIETFTEDSLTVALRETETEYLDEPNRFLFFDLICPSGFRC